MSKLKLKNDDRVCIIGGGPAGCFSAMNLLHHAEKINLKLEVLIFEYRNGSNRGPAGCKGCAGIISSTLIKNLNSIGVTIPDSLILGEIQSYVLHIPNIGGDVIHVNQPDIQRSIYSISRGGGPRIAPAGPSPSFDEFLRGQAREFGAEIINKRVKTVELEDYPAVITDDESYRCDLLVLASGVNGSKVLCSGFNYKYPETVVMVQDEFLKPDNIPDGNVAAFFGEPDDIFFGTLVPKGRYINVSLFGKPGRSMLKNVITSFLEAESSGMKDYFPVMPENLCGCKPRIVVNPAEIFYGDRWVAVGDSAVSRLYKDGIGSAFITSDGAMRSVLMYGISGKDFKKGYRKVCRKFIYDNFIGKILFKVFTFMLANPVIALSVKRCVECEKDLLPEKKGFTILIWGMLTGDYSYKYLLGRMFRIRSILRFIKIFFLTLANRME